jgi:phospholipid/cholesterol/gamma-HCH transport system ATP-binding protein
MQIVDYMYFVSEGRIVGHGTPEQIRHSQEPFIKQFVHAELDGPVPFHYPAKRYASDLGFEGAGVDNPR